MRQQAAHPASALAVLSKLELGLQDFARFARRSFDALAATAAAVYADDDLAAPASSGSVPTAVRRGTVAATAAAAPFRKARREIDGADGPPDARGQPLDIRIGEQIGKLRQFKRKPQDR